MITATLLGLVALATVMPIGEFAVNVVTLPTSDWRLTTRWLIYRFRDEHAADPDVGPGEWISRTTAIGDRAVFISGLAVAATMVGLSLFAE